MNYRGWEIWHVPTGPITGRVRAARFGVTMGANDEPMLRRMIDAKVDDERREKEARCASSH